MNRPCKLSLVTNAGFQVNLIKDSIRQCGNCNNLSYKTWFGFGSNFTCGIILGLKISNIDYGYCNMYEAK